MQIVDLNEVPQGTWFDLDGGGRIELKILSADEFKEIRKITVKKEVTYKRLDGKPERIAYDDVNEELQNELFWDKAILNWEGILDKNGEEIPCTKEMKVLLMSKSVQFMKIVSKYMATLNEDEERRLASLEKN